MNSFAKRKNIPIWIILTASFIIRIWKLGNIPQGLSLSEINFGLASSNIFGSIVLNPFIIRLPFALIGVLSIYLLFILIRLITKDIRYALITSFIFSVTPWHIEQSRIYSPGLTILTVSLLIAAIILKSGKLSLSFLLNASLIFSGIVFLFSIFVIPSEIRVNVDIQRNIAKNLEFKLPVQLFSNKIIETFRYRERLLFENLDIGNYFFIGYPRERWGVEEAKKLFISFIPLIIIGFFKTERKMLLISLAWGLSSLAFMTLLDVRYPGATILLLLPLTIIISSGLMFLLKDKKFRKISFIIILLFFIELLSYFHKYFFRYQDSLFAPRRIIYSDLITSVSSIRKQGERVLVSERLKDPQQFFKFYMKNLNLDNFEFRAFNVRSETDLDKLFIDVLPDDATPSEPLYKVNGNWPKGIRVLSTIYDNNLKQMVVIYRVN